jgi:hypothetical protein
MRCRYVGKGSEGLECGDGESLLRRHVMSLALRAAQVTLGPRGRTALLDQPYGPPKVTKVRDSGARARWSGSITQAPRGTPRGLVGSCVASPPTSRAAGARVGGGLEG